MLDLLEEESEEICQMGNWNPSIYDVSYSSKLPLPPIQKLVGYHSNQGFYWNIRTHVEPPEELLCATLMGKWVYNAYEGVCEADTNGEHQTSTHVQKFFCYLNMVFLQDLAAFMVEQPDQQFHPLFEKLDVFKIKEFDVCLLCWI
jgi:hypothetical protein